MEGSPKKVCAVAVPVWKRALSRDEAMSLVQLRCVLGRNPAYDIVLFGPERCDWGYYASLFSGLDCGDGGRFAVLAMEDRMFESRLSYSRLLCSRDFYSRFAGYGHVLVHQLDAWVMSDRLEEWCAKGYGYVGAPWCHLCRMGRGSCAGWESEGFVGNGGLSLRDVDAFAEMLPYGTYDDAAFGYDMNEDVYVSMVRGITRPKCGEAASFAVETDARRLIAEKLGGGRPFGFHALAGYDSELYGMLVGESFLGAAIMERVSF